MLWTKRAHQCTNFRLLGSLMMKVHPIRQAIFETTRSGFFKFCITFQCRIYLAKTSYTLDKIAHRSEIFGLLSGWVHQIPHVIFETTSQFFFKLCITLHCHGINLLYFFSWDFIWFLTFFSTTVQNFRLSTAQVKLHQIWTLIG